MKKSDNVKLENLKLHVRHDLNSLWVDGLNLNLRKDDLCLMRFFSSLPEGYFEESRLMTSKESMKNFVESMCSALNYYPKKDSKAGRKTD